MDSRQLPAPIGENGPQPVAPPPRPHRHRLQRFLASGTIAIMLTIIIAAVLVSHSNESSGTNRGALTNPNGLHPASDMLRVGTAAPNFDLATVDGQHIPLTSLHGHPVVLEFFAIWCPRCQNEATVLNKVDATFASRGERTLAILANPYGKNYENSNLTDLRLANRADVTWFETTFKVQHPTLIDPSFATVNRYGASTYPTIYVIDGNGIIRLAVDGDVSYQSIANALNKIMP